MSVPNRIKEAGFVNGEICSIDADVTVHNLIAVQTIRPAHLLITRSQYYKVRTTYDLKAGKLLDVEPCPIPKCLFINFTNGNTKMFGKLYLKTEMHALGVSAFKSPVII